MRSLPQTSSRYTALNTPHFIQQGQREFGMPASNIKPLVKLLVTQGVPLENILEGTGIQFEDFTDPNKTLVFAQYLSLIKNARKYSLNPIYTLQLGEQFFVNHDGILACRVMSSRNNLDAMELLTEYQNLFTQILSLSLEVTEDFGIFSVEESIPLGDTLPHFVEYCYAVLYSLGKFCMGGKPIELHFEFSHDNPGKGDEFSNFFHNTVKFNCDRNRVLIPRHTLDQNIIFSNQQAANNNERLCQQHLKQVNKDQVVIQKVKRIIRDIPFNELSIESLSDKLHMSTRTLRRHLQTQGVSYKTLLENERKRIALKRIEKQDISIEALAIQLGYQNASSFSRAFKRWFGVAPHHYKCDSKTH